MRYPQILAAAVLGASVIATPAAAETGVAVKYSDLDLSTERGQQALERRIDSAAREACGMDVVTGRFSPSTAQRQCLRETKTRVGEQVAQTIARDNSRS